MRIFWESWRMWQLPCAMWLVIREMVAGAIVLGCSVVCRWQVARRLESVEAGTGYGGSALRFKDVPLSLWMHTHGFICPDTFGFRKGSYNNKGPSGQERGTLLFCIVAGFINSGWFRTIWPHLGTTGSAIRRHKWNWQTGRWDACMHQLFAWNEGLKSTLVTKVIFQRERERERKLLSVSVSRHDFKPSTLIHRFWVWKRNVGTLNMPQLQVCTCVFSRNRQVGVEGIEKWWKDPHIAQFFALVLALMERSTHLCRQASCGTKSLTPMHAWHVV